MPVDPQPQQTDWGEWQETPQESLGPFVATYQRGEDAYDESFPIETRAGEFLGECGMGISDATGIGDADQVAAFEVWLFDKNDIRSVTKVLMSEYAYGDENLRAKLAPRGEPVLAEPGSPVILETSRLRVQVEITDLQYNEAEMPPRGFFDKLTVAMEATPKSPEPHAAEEA
jgi:hypothetical protein